MATTQQMLIQVHIEFWLEVSANLSSSAEDLVHLPVILPALMSPFC